MNTCCVADQVHNLQQTVTHKSFKNLFCQEFSALKNHIIYIYIHKSHIIYIYIYIYTHTHMFTKIINAKILRNPKIPLRFSSDSIISNTSHFTNFYMEQYFAFLWCFGVSRKNTTRRMNHILKIYCLQMFFF